MTLLLLQQQKRELKMLKEMYWKNSVPPPKLKLIWVLTEHTEMICMYSQHKMLLKTNPLVHQIKAKLLHRKQVVLELSTNLIKNRLKNNFHQLIHQIKQKDKILLQMLLVGLYVKTSHLVPNVMVVFQKILVVVLLYKNPLLIELS